MFLRGFGSLPRAVLALNAARLEAHDPPIAGKKKPCEYERYPAVYGGNLELEGYLPTTLVRV